MAISTTWSGSETVPVGSPAILPLLPSGWPLPRRSNRPVSRSLAAPESPPKNHSPLQDEQLLGLSREEPKHPKPLCRSERCHGSPNAQRRPGTVRCSGSFLHLLNSVLSAIRFWIARPSWNPRPLRRGGCQCISSATKRENAAMSPLVEASSRAAMYSDRRVTRITVHG